MDAKGFSDHPLWEMSRQARAMIADSEPLPDNDARAVAYDRIRFILSTLESYKAVEPQLFVREQLDNAAAQWQAVVSSMTTANNNPGSGYEAQAASQAESWLREAGGWHKPQSRSNNIAQQAKIEYQALVDSYQESNKVLRQSLLDLVAQQSARETEHSSQVSTLKQAVSDAEASLAALESNIKDDKTLLQTALSDHSEKFIAAQSLRMDKFTEQQAAKAEKFTSWLHEQSAEFDGIAEPFVQSIKASDARASQTLTRIKSLGNQTEIAAGLTNGDILSTKFAAYATQERTTSFWGFIAGIAATCLGIGWLAYVAVASFQVQEQLSWPWLVLKIGLTLALGGLATVLFRYGQQSLQTSRAYKRIELELRAIGPFLSDISDVALADAAKIAFLKRTFGKAWEHDKGKSDPSRSDAEGTGQSALDSLTAAISAISERIPKP